MKILWESKYVIFVVTLIVILLGIIIKVNQNDKYTINVKYKINIIPLNSLRTYEADRHILDKYGKKLIFLMDDGWVKENKIPVLNLITEQKPDYKKYTEIFNKKNEIITNEIYNEAIEELNLINSVLPKNPSLEKATLEILLHCYRIINKIDKGQKALSLKLTISKKNKGLFTTIFLSFIMGVSLGIISVLLKNGLRKLK